MWWLSLITFLPRSCSSPLKIHLPSLREVFIPTTASHIAVYCLSDLHADSEKNQNYVRERCLRQSGDQQAYTVMIVPGDIGAEVDRIQRVFESLALNYDAVCYVPGNHEVNTDPDGGWPNDIVLGVEERYKTRDQCNHPRIKGFCH